MASRLRASGCAVLIGARRCEARRAAREAGYDAFDCHDEAFFSERGRFLFADRAHILVNTVPEPSVISPMAKMPCPLCALELSGKANVLLACEALPYETIDGKSVPTRFFPQTAGQILAEAIERAW